MAEIKALNCPNCGGSIPDVSVACNFCGSKVMLANDKTKFVLAGKVCPKCGLENAILNNYCSHCGQNFTKRCPKCEGSIDLKAIYCPLCGCNIDMFNFAADVFIETYKNKKKEGL